MKPLVSIIIPTYNRSHLIGETLDSVIAQTYTNWECIVIDDGSTDNTDQVLADYCKKDSRFQYHHRPKNKANGPCSCRNYGFQVSSGKYINFFDSDDLFKANAIEILVNKIEEDSDAIIGETELIDIISGEYISKNKIYSEQMIQDYFIGIITFFVGGPIWKRSFLENQKQLFDEGIRNVDDWDFNLRMLYNKPKLVYIKKTLTQYRIHKDSFSKELIKLNKNEIISDFKAREKHYQLIKSNKDINIIVVRKFIIKRYNKYLKLALFQNNKIKYFLFIKLVTQEIRFMKFYEFFKTIAGFTLYLFFKKGYLLLKD